MEYQLSHHASGRAHTNTTPPTGDWKTYTIAAYRQRRPHEDVALRMALAERVRALIGREIAIETIWVELDERVALVVVDGIQFRYHQGHLVLLRACALCGSGRLASTPLSSPADVGYALGTWQPRHPQCQPDDPLH